MQRHMLEIVLFFKLHCGYKLYFSDYQPEDKIVHKVHYENGSKSFYHRIKPSRDFYFGNSARILPSKYRHPTAAKIKIGKSHG